MHHTTHSVYSLSVAGTATELECDEIVKDNQVPKYLWRNGTTCNNRQIGKIVGGFEIHKFRPCCYGNSGNFQL